MNGLSIIKIFNDVFFPKYGNKSLEGATLILVVVLVLAYASSNNAFLIHDLIVESSYTGKHISPGYYFGSAIGLFLIVLILTLVTTWLPMFGQSDHEKCRIFNDDIEIIFSYNFGMHFCVLVTLDMIKALGYYDKDSALDAMYVYWYLLGLNLFIFFLIKFIRGNLKKYMKTVKSGGSLNDSIDYLDISTALKKLEELERALDSGLIDQETFNELKLRIQERIKKDF
jgi:hypothetical protein